MPRPLASFVVLALLATVTRPARAQGDIRLGLGGGITLPVRGYADQVNRGLAGTGQPGLFPGRFRVDRLPD